MDGDRPLSGVGLVVGAVFGGVAGAVLAGLFGTGFLALFGYGMAGGTVVGTLAGRLVAANSGEEQFAVRVVGGNGAVGLLVGAPVGVLGAWALDANLLAGLASGTVAGLSHGVAVGIVLLSARGRRSG